jgi:acetamidase/formamidase
MHLLRSFSIRGIAATGGEIVDVHALMLNASCVRRTNRDSDHGSGTIPRDRTTIHVSRARRAGRDRAARRACAGTAGDRAIRTRFDPEQEQLREVPARHYPGKVHLLPATMETTQWGWFNNAQPPVLHVNSGDTIVFETMMHSHNQVIPGTTIEQIKKLRTDFPGRGPHTLTGPVYIESAEPGDVLKIRINKIVPRAYGTNFNVPGMFGEFPTKFPEGQVKYFYLDLERKVAEFAPGIEIPLAPFPGTIGVARAEPGQYSSVPPGRYAGNLDIRDLTEGTALYVPVFVKGALLWTGDSHAAQGNGEINLTALETAYKEMNVTVDVIKNTPLEWPRIETKGAWITVGIDRDLNKALEILTSETSKLLMEQRKLDKDQAAKSMMASWDCRVSQVVDVNKGLHCFTAKTRRTPQRSKRCPNAKTSRIWSRWGATPISTRRWTTRLGQ